MKKVKMFVFLVLSLCFTIFIASAEEANAADMHRLYNPNSGEHFYTANGNEKNHLVKVGWKYEGIGWTAPATGNAVYRLYNANAGDHHYTLNTNEKNHLVKVGWKYEGIGWYSDVKKTIPLYRAYNPNAKAGSHNYTVNYAEQKNLIRVGWKDEGIAWYGIKKTTPVTKYSVTVKHVGSDGKTLKTSTASVEKGKSYTAKAGSFSGYTLKGSNSQTVTVNGNKTITFNYTKNAAPMTKYTVTVKHVGSDGKELKKTTATIEKGKNYTAKAETFSGYTLKGSNSQTVTVNGNKTITFNYTKNAAPVAKYTITVKYVDKSTGKDIQTATTAIVDKGKSYKIDAPTITGYTVVAADKTKSISSVSKNETLTINYTKNATPAPKYTITVKHLEESTGKEIAQTTTVSADKGHTYTADAAVVTGYTHIGDFSQTVVVDGNKTITFKYKLIEYAVRVKHEDIDGNLLEVDNYVFVKYGYSYTAKAKSIEDYSLADEPTKTVTIKGVTFITFKYTKNPEYKITVKYIDKTSGKEIMKSTTDNIGKGKHFSVMAPQIDGYTVLPEDEVKSINSVSKDETLTIKYTKNAVPVTKYKITVNYVDETGNTIKTTTSTDIEKGKPFSMTAPAIGGYTVLDSDKTKSIGSVTKNETVTFKYKKNAVKYNVKIIHKGNDDTIREAENFQIEAGTNYSAKAKRFNGYVLTGKDTQNVLINKDTEIVFNYNNLAFHKVTLHGVLDGKIVKTVTFRVTPGEEFEPTGKKLDLDPKVYDVSKYSYWPKFTAVGGKSDEFRLQVWLFKNYLSDSELKIMQQTILQRVNELRKSLGREPLIEHPQLNAAATVRSKELNERLAHIRPDGRDIITAITDEKLSIIGYPGENIAYEGRPEFLTSGKLAGDAMFEGWEASEGHYLNMIDPDYKYFGVGVYCHGSFVYGTQLFIRGIR